MNPFLNSFIRPIDSPLAVNLLPPNLPSPHCTMVSLFPNYDNDLADQAMAILTSADKDNAEAHANAHAIVMEQHWAFFVKEGFGVDLAGKLFEGDDDALGADYRSKHKKMTTVEQYNFIICCHLNWGDNEVLASVADDDLEAIRIY